MKNCRFTLHCTNFNAAHADETRPQKTSSLGAPLTAKGEFLFSASTDAECFGWG
jgi:hypothetical protein